MSDFENKAAVITGGAGGIGKCIAEEFKKQRAAVCVIAKHGHIDYLINNALPLMKGIDVCIY